MIDIRPLEDIEEYAESLDDLQDRFQRLIQTIIAYHPEEDTDEIERAFVFAANAHAGIKRASGLPYIVHPLEVSTILAGMEIDAPSIKAGLLHDTVEDNERIRIEDIRKLFGAEVAGLVEGVTKLKSKKEDDEPPPPAADEIRPESRKRGKVVDIERQAENLRLMLLAVANDFRVMLIKLADRLHNMRTLEFMPGDKQQRTALETRQIFAPLAHRLGVNQLKWELEDLAFKFLEPEQFKEIADLVESTRAEREEEIKIVIDLIQKSLAREGIHAVIQGRPKHLYSIYNKMLNQGIRFEDIYDLTAVRIIVESELECYSSLGVVHKLFTPLLGLFSDHIANPKPNMYQSLHTKVMGPNKKPLEVQIRTFDMHRMAEYGVAAHWLYKEGSGQTREWFDRKMAFINRQLFQWNEGDQSGSDYLQNIIEVLLADQVFVVTPQRDVIDLPKGSTPVDFAYRIHTNLGDHTVQATVNGRMVPLNTELMNGDVVAIIQRTNAQPSLDWLSFVKTPHARTKIRQFHRKLNYPDNVQRGREMLEREMQRLSGDARASIKPEALEVVAKAMNYLSVDDLLAAIGAGQAGAQGVVSRLREPEAPDEDRILTGQASESSLIISAGGLEDLLITRAPCCHPLPGEDVIGYVTQGRGVTMHRRACKNVASLEAQSPDRLTGISWPSANSERFSVPVRVIALDRVGLLQEIGSVFTIADINISEANVRRQMNRQSVLDLLPEVAGVAQLEAILAKLNSMVDVIDAYRVTDA